VITTASGLALLFPILQYALDTPALRRMTPTAFGSLMALEPAMGLALGVILLSQHPSANCLPSPAVHHQQWNPSCLNPTSHHRPPDRLRSLRQDPHDHQPAH